MNELNFIFGAFKTILDIPITVLGFTFTFANIIVFFAIVGLVVGFLRMLSE